MSGQDLFLGMNQISAKFVEEAETVTKLHREKKRLPLRRPVLIAAMIALLLMLVGCGAIVYTILAEEPWASIPKVEGTDVPREDVQITITGVTPSYLTYHCDLDGFGIAEKQILFYDDAPCTIEKKTENGWEALPVLLEDDQWEADEILSDGHHDGKIHWAACYGYLDVGTYRVTAQILTGHDAFTLEFEITPEMRGEGLELAEDLVNREFWHIRETYSREFGSLENVPEEAKAQFLEDEGADDSAEFWKCGEDYLYLMYDGDQIVHGMMYRGGVKYKLTREWESNDAPIVGWMPWPDMDLNRVTEWAYPLEDASYERTVTHRADGTIESITLVGKDITSFDVEVRYTTNIQVLPTSRAEIARLLEDQNTNVWQAFRWEEDREKYEPRDVTFANTQPNPIATAADALTLAEKECTVEYTQVKVYRDEEKGIWKVEYQIMYGYQGYQFVYLNDEGITVMVSGAGSKVEAWQEDYPAP